MNRLNESSMSTLRRFIKESLEILVVEKDKNGEEVDSHYTKLDKPDEIFHIGSELAALKLAPLSVTKNRYNYGKTVPKGAKNVIPPSQPGGNYKWDNPAWEKERSTNVGNLSQLAIGLVPPGKEDDLAVTLLPWGEEGRKALIWVKERNRWLARGIGGDKVEDTGFLSATPVIDKSIPFPADRAIVDRLLKVQPNVGMPTGKGEFLFALMTGGIAGGEGDIQVGSQNWEVKDARVGPVRLGDKTSKLFRKQFEQDATVAKKGWTFKDLEEGMIDLSVPENFQIINNVLQDSFQKHMGLTGFIAVKNDQFDCVSTGKVRFHSFDKTSSRVKIIFI